MFTVAVSTRDHRDLASPVSISREGLWNHGVIWLRSAAGGVSSRGNAVPGLRPRTTIPSTEKQNRRYADGGAQRRPVDQPQYAEKSRRFSTDGRVGPNPAQLVRA